MKNREVSLPSVLPWVGGVMRQASKSLQDNSRGGTRTRDPGIMSAVTSLGRETLTSEDAPDCATPRHTIIGLMLPSLLPSLPGAP
jgi:hypothetical protein